MRRKIVPGPCRRCMERRRRELEAVQDQAIRAMFRQPKLVQPAPRPGLLTRILMLAGGGSR